MKRLLLIVSTLVMSIAISAQSLVTGVQYLGAAASVNASKKQQAEARGEARPVKVAFQMDVELSGHMRWGYIPQENLSTLNIGGNTTVTGGPGADIDLGVRINDSYFVGVGSQFGANFGKVNASYGKNENFSVHVTNLYIPIYGVFKVYIPSGNGVSPYVDFGIGGYLPDWYQLRSDFFKKHDTPEFDLGNTKIEGNKVKFQNEKGGFYLHGAVGVDMNHFQISAGYEMTTAEDYGNTRLYHNIFFKLGYRIGG